MLGSQGILCCGVAPNDSRGSCELLVRENSVCFFLVMRKSELTDGCLVTVATDSEWTLVTPQYVKMGGRDRDRLLHFDAKGGDVISRILIYKTEIATPLSVAIL